MSGDDKLGIRQSLYRNNLAAEIETVESVLDMTSRCHSPTLQNGLEDFFISFRGVDSVFRTCYYPLVSENSIRAYTAPRYQA
jgi:hypothetical protein